jgi:hypothetical protein
VRGKQPGIPRAHAPRARGAAHCHAGQGLYVDRAPKDLHQHVDTVATPLDVLGERDLCPGSQTLASINASLR